MKFLVALALVIFSVLKFDIAAADDKPEPFTGFTKYEKYHSDYAVNADGTHTETHEVAMAVLTDEGIDSANTENISYSEGLESLEILSAYTLKKDGRRIDVPAANIQEHSALESGGPMFSDIKTKSIIFPDVAAGDKVGYSYRLTQKTALFPGHFSLVLAFNRFTAYDDVHVSVSVPVDILKLRVLASGVGGGRLEDRAESICMPEDSRKFKPVAKAILNDLKAPILYK